MHKHLTIITVVWLTCGASGSAREYAWQTGDDATKPLASKQAAKPSSTPEKAPAAGAAVQKPAGLSDPAKKVSGRDNQAKIKAERNKSTSKTPDRVGDLSMEQGVVCKSIDGYEKYEPLRGAAQTNNQKLLVYVRALGFKTEKVDGAYQGHLTTDCEIRKRGAKAVIFQKKNIYEYKPRTDLPSQFIYLKNAFSIKGLAPGNYDLTIILRDQIAQGPPASQVVKFKVLPTKNANKKKIRNEPDGDDTDAFLAQFTDPVEPEDDE